mmetsp:Transcript_29093/g.40738  ORF Transcript_29093/g.40738 Transcript_29093/m.40738 type:complete len:374 (+) Transcript_29093:159-1280(+)
MPPTRTATRRSKPTTKSQATMPTVQTNNDVDTTITAPQDDSLNNNNEVVDTPSTVHVLTEETPSMTPTNKNNTNAAATTPATTPNLPSTATSVSSAKKGRMGSHQASWERNFQSLLYFKARFGDCLVPCKFKEDTTLSHWVEHQRKAKKKGKLAPERIKRLDEVGFIWKVQPGMKAAANAKRSCIGVPIPQVMTNRNKDAVLAAAAAALDGGGGAAISNAVKSLHHPAAGIESPGTATSRLLGIVGDGTGGKGSSVQIEVLLRTAAIKLGRDSNEVAPFVDRLHKEWYYETHQLQGLEVDTLARYIPHGLAREAMKLIHTEPFKWGISQNNGSTAAVGTTATSTGDTVMNTTTSAQNKDEATTTTMVQDLVPL